MVMKMAMNTEFSDSYRRCCGVDLERPPHGQVTPRMIDRAGSIELLSSTRSHVMAIDRDGSSLSTLLANGLRIIGLGRGNGGDDRHLIRRRKREGDSGEKDTGGCGDLA